MLYRILNDHKPKLLHVGCGKKSDTNTLPEIYNNYEEIRLDIDPTVDPDICCSITNIQSIGNWYDSIYSQHNLEHLHPFEVMKALVEFKRVLNDNGFIYIRVPDIEKVAELIIEGKILNTVYESEAGSIKPLDIMFGYSPMTYTNPYMTHKCAFTCHSLMQLLLQSGFYNVVGQRYGFDIRAIGFKSKDIDPRDILNQI